MQKLANRPAQAEPAFGVSLANDADAAGAYFAEMEAALRGLGPSAEREGERRAEAQAIKESARMSRSGSSGIMPSRSTTR